MNKYTTAFKVTDLNLQMYHDMLLTSGRVKDIIMHQKSTDGTYY